MSSAPTRTTDRITNLDTVRGIATLGILVMNAVAFALPTAGYFNLDAAGSESTLDWIIGIAGEIFVDQKTMGLFSMLFGAGIVLFADRAAAKSDRPLRLMLLRNALLLLIGLAHGLLWDGDVLRIYAVCAPLLIAVRKLSPRVLFATGTPLVLSSSAIALVAQTQIPSDGDGLGYYWFADGGEIGDVAGIFLLSDFFLRAAGMMLIGVALYRLGIVQGHRDAGYYRRMATVGLGVGLPIAAAGVVWQVAADWGPHIAVAGEAANTVATIPVALGYLGLISLWDRSGSTPLLDRVRAVGRMALTNYLVHTVVGITIFRLLAERGGTTRTVIAAFVLGMWALQLMWSKPWLEHFRFGPVEWAWRCATYTTRQPFRTRPSTPASTASGTRTS